MCKKCFCSIVPPNVLSDLAKKGSESSKKTLADLRNLRAKREATLAKLPRISFIERNADRYIYDSESSWTLRKVLLRKEGEEPVEDQDANQVYDIAGFMKEYLMNTFSYNSLDNSGIDLIFSIHYGENYNNAFWDGDEMAFGDGDGKYFIGFANSIDVTAHELMHGVTQFLSGLEYYSQSGALNEHFSDVFGSIIKQRMLNQSVEEADWLIGNDIVGPDWQGQALRSMSDPGSAYANDSQPGHMDNYYSGSDDNQGVHINSGIPNKAFYLASMDLGIGVTEQIWFQTLKELWSTAKFDDMLDKILEVTERLISSNDIPENSLSLIESSFDAVGIKKKQVA